MQLKKYSLLLASVVGLSLLYSCQKDVSGSDSNPATSPDSTAVVNTADKEKDTTLAYSRDIYLWYNQIPDTFNARNYADPDAIMTAIRNYSNEPGFSKPVDRWSFAMKQKEWDDVSSGISGDFGLSVFFKAQGDLRVKSVEPASPAGKAGIRRGWRITTINGDNNITTANADAIVNNVFYSTTTSFTFQKPDNTTANITLNAATYQEHPIYLDTVYTAGAKKVGYMVFNSFLGDTTEIYNGFQRIFNRFAQAGISDLIVDLRYNGGGYVTVQEKLADYIAPSSASGNLMMKQQYNDKYSSENSSTNFAKRGSLNINNVFFIVSNGTASASELLINNLKPYMNVNLVGPNNTYGKPVGFFNIPVGDWYIFPVSFRSTNKNGEGNYFNGLALNSRVADGLDKDWGDVTETCLASALKYINTGSFRLQNVSPYVADARVTAGNSTLDRPSFKGMIAPRKAIR